MRNRIFLVVIFIAASLPGISQCLPETMPFGDGEKITYIATYNWGVVWVDAGEVTFSVEKSVHRGVPAFHLRVTGRTYKAYDLLFKVKDYYDSWVAPATLRPFGFSRQIYEGGYMLQNNISFYPAQNIALSNTKRPDKPIKTDTIGLDPCLFDMLSSIYYVRSLDLKKMKEEEILPVHVIIDDSVFVINVKKLGEEVKENRDGVSYKCIKLSAAMVEGTIFRKGEDAIVWVTDDQNKIPVVVEAKILVGTVIAYLKEAKGISVK